MKLLISPLETLGRFTLFIKQVLRYPCRGRVFWWRFVEEVWSLAIRSTWIVSIVSLFVGAVITIEFAFNLNHPLLPPAVIGMATRDTVLLEFSSTIMALVLAGKIGGSIASEIGTMRITEQIDALDVMGVNSAAFLVLPKMLAGVVFLPLLTVVSFIIAVAGGGIAGVLTGVIASQDFIEGTQMFFNPYYIRYTCMKMSAFGFVITTVPAFWGYTVHGGSLEVGRASTRGVVDSSIGLLMVNLVLTELFLT